MSEPTFASSIVAPSTPVKGDPSAVTLTDLSNLTKLAVKTTTGRTGGLQPAFGSSTVLGQTLVCGTRPGEWTVIGPADEARAIVAPVDAHVIDLTHGRTLLELAGHSAAAALEKVCSLDWNDAMTPEGAVVSASVAKVACDIIRRDRAGQPAYLLAVDRSLGQYLYDALVDALDEFNQ